MAINVLEPKVYNRISAGEVVERPASIVKELVENSIDAGATQISIEIEEGGIRKIQVADNGCGIEKEDMFVAFKPHATSKIKNIEDLDEINSLGFRGEALASISSVCHVYLSSKTKNSDTGYSLKVDGGEFGKIEETARQNGTTLIARDLFFNTPVRAKFLRKPKSEESEVTHLVEKFMLSHPEIAFSYYIDGKRIYNTPSCTMKDNIYVIYGREVFDSLLEVDYTEENYHLFGYITKPKISKSNRTFQTLFVNNRYVENYLISSSIQGVYENFLMKGKFPIYVLNLSLPADCVDVNVHPSKKEVKFENSSWIFGFVRRAVEKTLLSSTVIAEFGYDKPFEENKEEESAASSEFNMQGFNPIYKNREERVSDTQGSSFVKSVDHTDKLKELKEVVLDEGEKFVEGRKPLVPEDFKNMTLPDNKVPENKFGNSTIFFDQDFGPGHLHDIIQKDLDEQRAKRVEEEKFLSSSVADQIKILGTVFNTYIICELDDNVYFIDQHASHERLLYDKLIKQVNSSQVAIQDLLVPYSFTLGAKEVESLERLLEGLQEIGFRIDCKGGNTYAIKAIPLVLNGLSFADFIDEVVKDSITFEKKPSQFIHEKLCQSACKHAIKGGDSLNKGDCAYLIDQIRKGVMLCPHGRPIVCVLTKKEIEKMFGRIV